MAEVYFRHPQSRHPKVETITRNCCFITSQSVNYVYNLSSSSKIICIEYYGILFISERIEKHSGQYNHRSVRTKIDINQSPKSPAVSGEWGPTDS